MHTTELLAPILNSFTEKRAYLKDLLARKITWPITIGGMGIDFSNGKLAITAPHLGFIPTLSASLLGYNDIYQKLFPKQNNIELSHQANAAAIEREIKAFRQEHPHQILAVNLMKALSDYNNLVDVIGQSKEVDFLVVGAGLASDLAESMHKYPQMGYILIVSSFRAARLLLENASKHDRVLPAALYVELPQHAGGHLGAKNVADAEDLEKFDAAKIREEIYEFTKDKAELRNIPVILGGGIAELKDIEQALAQGYQGVTIGTLALVTQESGMPNHILRDIYLNKELAIKRAMTSPAGLPSTYVDNPKMWIEAAKIKVQQETRSKCTSCIGSSRCGFLKGLTPYCIAHFLSAIRRGEDWGLPFTGEKVLKYIREAELWKNQYIPLLAETRDFFLYKKLPDHFLSQIKRETQPV